MTEEIVKTEEQEIVELNGKKVTLEKLEEAKKDAKKQKGIKIREIIKGIFKTKIEG